MKVHFTIPGKPFAKQRPRLGKWGVHTPKETVSFERIVGQIASLHIKEPLTGPLTLWVHAYFKIPKSWSKKKAENMLYEPHTQRPDLDNILKAISDGLNRIAYADDSQIYSFKCEKYWSNIERTEVFIFDRTEKYGCRNNEDGGNT